VYTPASGNVYVGGDFSLSGTTPVNHVAKLVANQWTALGSGIPSVVNAITEHNGSLYAGCDLPNDPVQHWNGSTWSPVSGLSGGKVNALASYGSDLYAGGDFSTPIRAAAKWNGSSWSTILTTFNAGQRVNVLYSRAGVLYVGGNFTGVGLNPAPNYIGRITSPGTPLRSMTISSELTNGGEVLAIANKDGYVLAGGKFTTPTNPPTNNITSSSTTINIDDPENIVTESTLYPNPVHSTAILKATTSVKIQKPDLLIFDLQSRPVTIGPVEFIQGNNELSVRLNLSGIPAGNYYYILTEEGRTVLSDKFVVE
jgi:hypothetical protein